MIRTRFLFGDPSDRFLFGDPSGVSLRFVLDTPLGDLKGVINCFLDDGPIVGDDFCVSLLVTSGESSDGDDTRGYNALACLVNCCLLLIFEEGILRK